MDGCSTFYDAEEYIESYSDCSDDYQDVQEFASESTSDWCKLHRLTFEGKIAELRAELSKCSQSEKLRLDSQGNSILHVAVLRNNKEAMEIILDSGIPSTIRNFRRWSALDEAIAAKNRDLVNVLYSQNLKEVKTEFKAAKTRLIQTLNEMPDYSMELTWQLGSPVIGYLLRKFAPNDTYRIYKLGSKIRVDGTLMGIDQRSNTLLPEWKRGNFSLIFDGSVNPSLLYLVFHDREEYVDLTEEKQERKKNGTLDFDVDLIMSDGAGKTKLRASEFRFKPVKGWITSQLTEKIGDWNTKVYEASGKMVAITRLKSPFRLPSEATFDNYLNANIKEDEIMETQLNPSTLDPSEMAARRSKENKDDKKSKSKKISGRCWMAEDFPMSLRQLLPLLDVVGHANKHIGKVSKFMKKYGDMNMFPVKIQVPLLLTVYLLVSFKKFKKFETEDESWCSVPDRYKKIKLESILPPSSLSVINAS